MAFRASISPGITGIMVPMKTQPETTAAAILLCAGKGTRMNDGSRNKVCFDCAGVTFTYTDYLDKFKDVSAKEKKHQEYDDEFFGKKAAG